MIFYAAFKKLFVDESSDETALDDHANLLRPLFRALLIAASAVVVVLVLDLIFGLTSGSMLGPFGDFFGGVLNPIFTFLTFFGLIITIVIQRMELRLARQEYAKTVVALNTQAVENTFFNVLDLHHEIVGGLSFNPEVFPESQIDMSTRLAGMTRQRKSVVSGRSVFTAVLTEVRNRSSTPQQAYENYQFLQTKHNGVLGHYFRNLYQALKLIDSYPDESLDRSQKEKYASILRSQLSSDELAVLFLNCLAGMVDGGQFRNLIVRYRMLEHLPLRFQDDMFRTTSNDLAIADLHTISYYMTEHPAQVELPRKLRGAFGTNPVPLPGDA
ncbi:MAG: hypothetical protein A2710_24340 [Burkholderiales bacterium RIFCSPHIGHO2_01_FULL_64_960]|nr:MAG: hypothetical protein A2710_24340 [Burkholderiales bacterium RIFCSPHIGHO2_01_FULL_64_960]